MAFKAVCSAVGIGFMPVDELPELPAEFKARLDRVMPDCPVIGMITPHPSIANHFMLAASCASFKSMAIPPKKSMPAGELYIFPSESECEEFSKRIESMVLDERAELDSFERARLGIPFDEQEDKEIDNEQ